MSEDLRNLYYNTLILLLSFEKYWSINNKTKGHAYRKQAKLEAGRVCKCIKDIVEVDNGIIEAENLKLRNNTNDDVIESLKALEEWAVNDEDYIQTNRKYFTKRASLNFHLLILALENFLCDKLELHYKPQLVRSSDEDLLDLRVSEWLGQIHPSLIEYITPSFIADMNEKDTIVLVADIRRSQDLMTYGPDDSHYTTMINEFIASIQQIILNNNGIFDKFTGDGFIAYFNESLCELTGSDFYNQMWLTCTEVMRYADSFITEWTKYLRKIPSEPIGLSIGVDSGRIFFSTSSNQMMAVGEPSIWATRMCSAGHKNEVVFNNIPYNNMIVKFSGMNFYDEDAKTKAGEDFVCHKILIQ